MNLIKKYISIAFSALFVFSSAVSSPVEAAKNFSYEVIDKNKKTAILTKIDTNKHLKLKDPIDGYSIIEVANNASSFKQIKNRHLLSKIGYAALAVPIPLILRTKPAKRAFKTDISFTGPKITAVNLPNCVRVGECGFAFCNKLKTIDLPKCQNLEGSSLYGCTSITKLNIPQCKRIDDIFDNTRFSHIRSHDFFGEIYKKYSHKEYSKFEELNAPRCTEITGGSLSNFEKLKEVNLQSCKKIGAGVFGGCKSLKTLDLPNFTEVLTYNDGRTLCGIFEDCENLESINIPKLTSTNNRCFMNCKALKKIDLSKCKETKQSCCENCTSLTTALLDASTEIGNFAFKNCNSLENVRMPNVVSIGEGAFYGTALKRVDLPNCNSIGKAAFNDCKKLTVFNSPNITSIGESAFEGCENLEEIELPNCTVLGKNAFKDCKNLKKITIPKSCKLEGDCISYDLVIDGKLKVVKI